MLVLEFLWSSVNILLPYNIWSWEVEASDWVTDYHCLEAICLINYDQSTSEFYLYRFLRIG